MKKAALSLGILLVCRLPLCAQQDTTSQMLKAVQVSTQVTKNSTSATPAQSLHGEQLVNLPILHISDALKFLPGMVVKDYGGVGGLKSVSIRGFGAQHTGVAYDGIAVSDYQSGQIDLGRFSVNQVENLSLHYGFDDIFLPARLFASAGVISIKSVKPTFKENKPYNITVGLEGGSFGLWHPSLYIENRLKKKSEKSPAEVYSSIKAEYLRSKGNYPYTLYYGTMQDSSSIERRSNSDMQSLSAEANLFALFDDAELNFKFCYYHSERGLPGATLLYNPHSSQRLWDDNLFGQLHYKHRFGKRFFYQANAKFNYAYQRYLDPEYLNVERVLDNRYTQREAYLSHTFQYKPFASLAFAVAQDYIYGNMSANTQNFAYPQRFTLLTTLSGSYHTKRIKAAATLLHTFATNQVRLGDAGEDGQHVSPLASFSIKPWLKEEFRIRLFYKNIFRLPTFNDLYYREVGNVQLKPEKTHQFNGGVAYEKYIPRHKIHCSITTDVYYNMVKDKIVAFPTKNLFIWSMLNFGEVSILGSDISVSFSYQIIKQFGVSLSGSYTFQNALDLTDPESKSYRHQIPYTPYHSGSAFLHIKTTWIEVIYTLMAVGKRYTSPQNLVTNELPAYTEQSIGLAKTFAFKKLSLKIKGEVINLTNTQYEIIRNYPMQGRGFRVSGEIGF